LAQGCRLETEPTYKRGGLLSGTKNELIVGGIIEPRNLGLPFEPTPPAALPNLYPHSDLKNFVVRLAMLPSYPLKIRNLSVILSIILLQ
jgi:hypothetical protein